MVRLTTDGVGNGKGAGVGANGVNFDIERGDLSEGQLAHGDQSRGGLLC